jgi:hypothetical protein
VRILDLPLVETRAEHILAALRAGTISTNVVLRRPHDFVLGVGWLLAPLLPLKRWLRVPYKPTRANPPSSNRRWGRRTAPTEPSNYEKHPGIEENRSGYVGSSGLRQMADRVDVDYRLTLGGQIVE